MDEKLDKFMPDAHQMADGVRVVPQEMDTPKKSAPVQYPPLKGRMKAHKPWKPKGRK